MKPHKQIKYVGKYFKLKYIFFDFSSIATFRNLKQDIQE
jgi:hypothetical protein